MIYISRYKNNGIVSTHDENEKWTTEKESIIITLKDYIFSPREKREREEREFDKEYKQ